MSIAHVELRDLFLNLVDESLSIVDIEFAVDMRDMRFDGAIGQAEYLANIRTASALSQKEEYLAFAGGKIVPLRDFQMVFRQGFADALLYRGFVALCWLACACRTIALKLAAPSQDDKESERSISMGRVLMGRMAATITRKMATAIRILIST